MHTCIRTYVRTYLVARVVARHIALATVDAHLLVDQSNHLNTEMRRQTGMRPMVSEVHGI